MVRHFLLAATVFYLLLPSPAMGVDAKPPQTTASVSSEQYHYQKILYSFLTGDHLYLSKTIRTILDADFPEKDRALLILRLSDTRRQHATEHYPAFTPNAFSKEDMPFLLKLLDTIYSSGDYEKALSISKEMVNETAARYFEGMSLLHLNRLGESSHALKQIVPDNRFYPYARIALAQIEVMKHNFKEAEKYIRDILSYPSMTDDVMAEKAHLLLGQVLFEMGNFTDALNEFLLIPLNSPLHREALLGQAWSLTSLDSCEDAIPLLKEMKPSPPYDTIEKEALITLGYCYIKTGKHDQATEYLQTLLGIFNANYERLEQMIADRATGKRYISLVQDEISPATEEEQYYLALLRSDQTLFTLIKEHETFSTLKDDFLRKENEIIEKETNLVNTIKGLEELIKTTNDKLTKVKMRLLAINNRADQIKGGQVLGGLNNLTFFTGFEQTLYTRWQQILKRQLNKDEKETISLIIREGTHVMECLESATCPVLSIIRPDKKTATSVRLEQRLETAIMDVMGKDLTSTKKGEKIIFEKIFLSAVEKAQGKIKKSQEDIKKLQKMREDIKKDLMAIENGRQENPSRLEAHIMQRLTNIGRESQNLKADIIAMLDTAKKDKERLAATGNKAPVKQR